MSSYARLVEWVNSHLSFRDEYQRIFGKELPYGNAFCPFHNNVVSPAAKLYGNWLKCYGCGRSYSVFDLLQRFDPDSLKRLSMSGVIPETGFLLRSSVRSSRLRYASLSDVPSGVVLGSFDFYKFLSEFE